jgi:molecular chaperone Hsp33
LQTALGEVPFEVLEEREVGFSCTCSYERAASLISSIDGAELETMLQEDRGASLNCHFCNEVYHFDESALGEMLERGRNGRA